MKREWPIVVIMIAAMASGCGTSSPPAARRPAPVGEGRLIVTLNGPERSPIDLTAELTGVMLHARGGGWFQIPVSPLTINSLEMVRRQIPLADVPVPAGHYDQLTLKFGKASIRQEGRVVSLAVPPEGFTFNVPVEVERGAAAPLFLAWDVDRSVANQVFLAAAFSFEGKEPELRGVVAYVTNEESGTLSVVDRAKGQVVSTIQMGRAPRGIVVEPDTRRAFVLNGGSDSVTIIDVNTHRAVFTFNLEVRSQAQELAVSPQGQSLYVTNTALNSLSVLDTASFGVTATVPVGISPVSVAVDPRGSRVLVANQGSNNVSVIDTFTNRVVATASVEPGPAHIAVDANPGADRAFVASPMSAFMSVVSVSTGQVLRRLSVGPGAVATIPDVIANRLFVVKAAQNRVAVFDTSLNVEIGGFAVGRTPHRIALDPDRDKLYVVNRGGDSVTVADRLSRRVEGVIPVGKRPFAMALVR